MISFGVVVFLTMFDRLDTVIASDVQKIETLDTILDSSKYVNDNVFDENCNDKETGLKNEIASDGEDCETNKSEIIEITKLFDNGVKNDGIFRSNKNTILSNVLSNTKLKKKYSCTVDGCDAKYDRPSRLNNHIQKHIGARNFKCHINGCLKSYLTKCHLIRHIKFAHEEKKKLEMKSYTCHDCKKIYLSKYNLDRHIKRHQKMCFKCECCSMKFVKKHMLTAHMYEHTSVKGFSCDFCTQSFVTLKEKKKHLRRHKKYECDMCDEIFMNLEEFKEHKNNAHKKLDFVCDHCQKTFKKRQQILQHLKRHENKEKYCFVCPHPDCSKYYLTKYNLTHHIKSAHLGETFDCTICDAKLSTKAKLKMHVEIIHKGFAPVRKKILKPRAPRKDKGIPKKSAATKIAGLPLSQNNKLIKV